MRAVVTVGRRLLRWFFTDSEDDLVPCPHCGEEASERQPDGYLTCRVCGQRAELGNYSSSGVGGSDGWTA